MSSLGRSSLPTANGCPVSNASLQFSLVPDEPFDKLRTSPGRYITGAPGFMPGGPSVNSFRTQTLD